MTMGYDYWSNLLKDLLIDIVHKISLLEDYYRFSSVSKSWKSATEAVEKPWLPTITPMLLLAEEVAPGSIPFDAEYDTDEEVYSNDNNDDDDAAPYLDSYDYLKNSVGTSRGLYSLSSRKTYNIELPEAAGKLILGTSKGWLVTLGRDFQINLLHPLLRLQFSLPPMLTFPGQPDPTYHERYTAEDASEQFIQKVAMSSNLLNKKTDVSLFDHHATPSPIVMAIYEAEGSKLGFARLGDKVWTNVNFPSDHACFHDIVYHKGNFYAVDFRGGVYVCCIDDDKGKREPRGTKIASIETNDWDQKYLVEPLSGSGLLVLVRYTKYKYFKNARGTICKYRTTDFTVWRLDVKYSDSLEIPCTSTKVNNLGNEALFVGRASSFSVSSSEIIKPNSIYFTDDNSEAYLFTGGGHDMGIFNMERRTSEPHFQGKSIHCISPPLWYI